MVCKSIICQYEKRQFKNQLAQLKDISKNMVKTNVNNSLNEV